MALTSEQSTFYRDNGCLVVENLIDEVTLQRLRGVIADLREQSRRIPASNELFDVAPGHSPAAPKLRRVKDPVLRHPEFDALMRSDKVVDIVAELLGGTVRFDHSKLNFKPPNGNARIEWHQDWAFYPHTNDDLLAVGVMIEDCTEDNGPLMVIPGSHKGPVHDHHLDGVFAGGVRVSALESEIARAVALTAPAGSISIHHVRTLHASSENRSDAERPLLLYSYAAVDAFPIFETHDLAEFDARILRGAPTLVPRLADVPVRLHLPLPPNSQSIFEKQEALVAAT